MNGCGFDRLARIYRSLERLVFGEHLQRCRTAWLPELAVSVRADPCRVLILGEGDGRFLVELLRANGIAKVVVVDRSVRMCALAAARIASVPDGPARARFVIADAAASLPVASGAFDLVICNFFLDCFSPQQLAPMIPRIAASLASGGRMVVGDFARPEHGVWRVLASPLLWVMHRFFGWFAGIGAQRLSDPGPLLVAAGLRATQCRKALGGLLRTTMWQA